MTFFDKKEEVIQVELTQYGKYLLSLGRWKPTYYAFFDDDIIYDGACAGISEVQNDIEPRIQENTPHLKTQHTFLGRETDFLNIYHKQTHNKTNEMERLKMESPRQREYVFQESLGTADYSSQKSAAWKIDFLAGKVETATALLTGSVQTLRIPQIDCDITYKTSIKNINDTTPNSLAGAYPEINIASEVFTNGAYVAVETDPFILLIEEKNGIFEKENFDIEVYRSGTNGFDPVFFKKREPQVINGLYVPKSSMPSGVDETYVEYFFDILVDSEISKNQLCQSIQKLKSQNKFVDIGIDCGPEGTITVLNPYIDAAPDSVCDDNDGEPSF